MTNLMRRAQAWLSDRLTERCGEPVLYSRGNVSVTMTAVRGMTTHEQQDQTGAIVMAHVHDFLLHTETLMVSIIGGLPKRGDIITDDSGTQYEVLSLGDSPPWRFSDPQGIKIRVHTKRIV